MQIGKILMWQEIGSSIAEEATELYIVYSAKWLGYIHVCAFFGGVKRQKNVIMDDINELDAELLLFWH